MYEIERRHCNTLAQDTSGGSGTYYITNLINDINIICVKYIPV